MSKLYIIPTPIGNLEDITLRALRILKEADILLAEDTRTSGFLLKHFNIEKKIYSHHQHNEHKTVNFISQEILSGKTVALMSDAGTPGISDPGFLLVRECLKNNIEVECLPGPTAFVPALIQSGLPCDSFVFEGFLPHKKGRKSKFDSLSKEERTIVLYESPYRIVKTLEQIVEHLGPERKVCVCRELTKKFEENIRGTASEVLEHFKTKEPKGEFVIIVEGKSI
jgi:16S rRNA (cytidine1402-2'-O)-methyltransferase